MAIFAETPRLILRSLEEADLPRLVELVGDWEIIRWLAVVPFPYSMKNAEDFYAEQAALYRSGTPECFMIASKTDNKIMGAVGLRAPSPNPMPEDGTLGYWLGMPFWRQGFLTEAVEAIMTYAFDNQPERKIITASTDVANQASQGVLRKLGFDYLGVRLRRDKTQRGNPEITCWQMEKENFFNQVVMETQTTD